MSRAYDNGSQDDKIASLGLRKVSIHEIAGILEPLGIRVIPPKKAASGKGR